MMDALIPYLAWIKALHVLSVIAWMAGMLYLPRLFVYHADAETGGVQSETFKVMERRLYRGITTPAMIATWLFGLLMLGIDHSIWWGFWPWVKAAAVIVLSGIHGFYGRLLRDFANDRNTKSSKFFRAINEIPFVLAIVIVIMVIVKPF
jgi:putative membrane protein